MKDFILYILTYEYANVGVLVQEDVDRQDQIIYYVSKNLLSVLLRYPHEENLVLSIIFSV